MKIQEQRKIREIIENMGYVEENLGNYFETYSKSTSSIYKYAIIDNKAYCLRISDHNYEVEIDTYIDNHAYGFEFDGLDEIGYTVTEQSFACHINVGTYVVEERYERIGQVIYSDKFKTIVDFMEKEELASSKEEYLTSYIFNRLQENRDWNLKRAYILSKNKSNYFKIETSSIQDTFRIFFENFQSKSWLEIKEDNYLEDYPDSIEELSEMQIVNILINDSTFDHEIEFYADGKDYINIWERCIEEYTIK